MLFETLEQRRLMSGAVLRDGVLTVIGNDGDDQIILKSDFDFPARIAGGDGDDTLIGSAGDAS